MAEDIRVRVEDRHGAAVGETGSREEVAGAGTHIEVVATDPLLVSLQESGGRAVPDEPGDGAEDQGVVRIQEEPRVIALALVCGVVMIHVVRRCSTVVAGGRIGQG